VIISPELPGQARSHQGGLVKGITQIAFTLLDDYRHGAGASFTATRSIQVKACQPLELLDVFKAVRVRAGANNKSITDNDPWRRLKNL